jgi:predicted glycogen debranching enzyme
MAVRLNTHDEWLEPDGLGGFASGTVSAIRTRRYHALLLTARTPPTGRIVLVNGFDAWITTLRGNYPLTSQVYEPGVVSPQGWERIESFDADPWPKWRYAIADGLRIEHELFVPHGSSAVVLTWRVIGGASECTLSVRPFLSGRDYHSLHAGNSGYRFDPKLNGGKVAWRPYSDMPSIHALSNGEYIHEPQWYRNFIYEEESARGLNYTEDLASPGAFRWDLSRGPAALILAAEGHEQVLGAPHAPAESVAEGLRHAEARRRSKFAHPLHRAADAYIVKRGEGKTIVAGYPWFTDWGRDTFIALRGLCLSTGRIEEARNILVEWAGAVSDGMLPNFFSDNGAAPEYNTVDASLWYIIAVHDYLQTTAGTKNDDDAKLRNAVNAILTGYAKGTRYHIQMDVDGLLSAGGPGVQLTWMDAKVGDWVVTPRIGKPVEIQALWINALRIGSDFADTWDSVYKHALASFQIRFWNDSLGQLYDVIDCDHRDGAMDASFRPNQILAVGGLPFRLLEGERARRLVDAVESKLWTPIGLRSLAPGEQAYRGRYEGGVADRDGSYHQGTVWPWLMGAFVDAWVSVRGATGTAKQEARERFLAPLLEQLGHAGLGHISEIADGDAPHTPRGCPFQAWSVGEALRIHHDILGK